MNGEKPSGEDRARLLPARHPPTLPPTPHQTRSASPAVLQGPPQASLMTQHRPKQQGGEPDPTTYVVDKALFNPISRHTVPPGAPHVASQHVHWLSQVSGVEHHSEQTGQGCKMPLGQEAMKCCSDNSIGQRVVQRPTCLQSPRCKAVLPSALTLCPQKPLHAFSKA